ncbi:MAG: tetratricopeptide repeat protein [Acidobacteriota bacterium]
MIDAVDSASFEAPESRQDPQPQRVLPAGLLHLWPQSEPEVWAALVDHLTASLGPDSGVYAVRDGLIAVVPTAGDPAVLDTATSYARFLAAAARRPKSGGGAEATMLVTPGTVRVGSDRITVVADRLFEDLISQPPQLTPGQVHLTGRAVQTLEIRREAEAVDPLVGASGRPVPLFRLGHVSQTHRLWRNPNLLGRKLASAHRPELVEALKDALGQAVVRVRGAMGCGKTRAVLEALDPESRRIVRVVVPAGRSAVPPLAAQLARALLQLTDGLERVELGTLINQLTTRRRLELMGREASGDGLSPTMVAQLLRRIAETHASRGQHPLTLVCDDLERASQDDLALLAELAAGCSVSSFQLVLVGRGEVAWPDEVRSVEVPPFEAEEMDEVTESLFSGLSLPEAVHQDLLESAGGVPFVLEEGLAALIHAKLLRQIYGSFFFSGEDDVRFRPSDRLVAHVEAEALRVGHAVPLRLLAASAFAVPSSELRSAASILGSAGGPKNWYQSYLEAGWLEARESPWGEGLQFASRGIGDSLRRTLDDPVACRHAVGELLVELSGSDRARWQAYQLVSGSAEGVPILLRVARQRRDAINSSDRPATDEDLLAALTHEVVAHRSRKGDSETELELLMTLLPIALQTANLEGLAEELKHAMHLALQQAEASPETLLALARLKADLDRREGRLDKAEQTLQSALRSSRTTDKAGKAALLLQLGRVLMEQQRFDEAERLLEQVLEPIDQPGFESLTATCRFYLGNIALRQHRLDKAYDHHLQALKQRRERPEDSGKPTIASLTALGAVCLSMGRYSESLLHYQAAEQGARALGDRSELSYVLLGLGRILGRLGDFAAASAPLRQALALREEAGDELGEALARLAVAVNHLDLDRPQDALREAREASFRLNLLPDSPFGGRAERLLGRIQLARRRTEEAHSHLLKGLQLHQRFDDPLAAAFDRAWLVETAITQERTEIVDGLIQELGDFLAREEYPEQGERLDYRMFRALEWMAERGHARKNPLPFLQRAYDALLRKAGRLDPELRQHFLYQIPINQQILVAATRNGIAS